MTSAPGGTRLVPASYAQESLWATDQIQGRDGLLNLAVSRRLRGPLDADRLRAAVLALVTRHEMLRTTFTLVDGALLQQVHAEPPVDFAVVEVSDADPERRCRELAAQESVRGFDLTTAPLVRTRLYRLSTDDHVLLVTMHHLLCDKWSVDVLLRDLGATYRALREGTAPDLQPVPFQYADHAVAQRAALREPYLDELREYWKEALAGGSATLELPPDRIRPSRRTSLGAGTTTFLPADLVAAAVQLARRERATPFAFFLAAFRVLLWRHTGQRDQRIGVALDERDRPELEQLIGFFINMLVLRNPLPGGHASFREVLAAERDASLEALEHRDLPYTLVVDALRPRRDQAASPLFAVSFSYHVASVDPAGAWEPLRIESFPLDVPVCQFDLVVDVVQGVNSTEVTWAFNDEVYQADTIARLAGRLPVILRAIVADPDRPIGDLPVLSAADEAQLRALRAGAAGSHPSVGNVVELFDHWATQTPEAVAVRQGRQTRTYARTAELSRAVAARLGEFGLAPEAGVGVLLRRSADIPAIILGVLRAGLAAVPVDPAHPVDRIATTLTAAAVGVLVRDDDHPQAAGGAPAVDGPWKVLTVAELTAGVGTGEGVGSAEAVLARRADQLAYVLYTSGSTGTPKGVAVTHGSLANCLTATGDALSYRPGQRWLAVSRTTFDISLLELFTPLVSGGEVIVATDEQALDGTALRGLLESSQPDFMQATPGFWQMLYDSGWSGNPGLVVSTGGDVVNPALAARLIRDNAAFWHTYGPTEATLYCVSTPLASVEPGRILPLGHPIRRTGVQILDGELRPVPPGAIGELCIAGAGLARGYLNRPDLTAERFVPDPSAGDPGARLYRTGDLALLRPDGRLELHGRNDRQVKLRGYRIELGEVESVLTSCPGVVAAAVVRAGTSPETYRLVAFVRLAPGTDLAGVRERTAQRLPRYMLPSSFHVLDRIPTTPNGKVDRDELARLAVPAAVGPRPAAPGTAGAASPDAAAPATPEEIAVAEVWAELLELDSVSRFDDFFVLGGNSLLAVRAVRMLHERLGTELSIWMFFETPTVADLADQIRELRSVATTTGPASGPASPLAAGASSAAVPLVWLRGRRPDPLLALVHAAGGSILCYRELVTALGPGRDVCGFETTVAAGEDDADGGGSVEELAARYLTHMPTGWRPERTVLGGWSMGGLIAYEMAVQLARRDGVLLPVVLIDTQILAGSATAALTPARAVEALVQDVATSLGVPATDLPRDLAGLAHAAGVEVSQLSRRLTVMRTNADLAARYLPPAYPGRVEFVAPVDRPTGDVRGWQSRVGQFSVTSVAGDHHTALRGAGARRIAQLIDGLGDPRAMV